ncbi:LLM class flavin-dependent oxidoreductase [Salinadaptatus halalkaliphilus]|uniref:LLM class flavin-dependent oxidoreductase n=1 Tax=Salinadaptatus halalkaliphilus TaxID=2419781 RepID=A0A4S3TK62_9EURY|nr:LLM class flavin-dependent oxidoreductase [Salinadaptatus halalkaliphilus]THE63633.1 LLM class flavin-dependent oxidoreductase [Salinadaptatus halalkaliphilus]
MVEIRHKLVSELHGPNDLVEYAQLTEQSNLAFANVSDHFHPWLPEQGESRWSGTSSGRSLRRPTISHHGEYYTVENAKLYTLPDELPEIGIAADGPKTARKAGEIGDGLITVVPDEGLVDAFESSADAEDAPIYGEATVCYAEDDAEAIETVADLWPQEVLPSSLLWDLPTPAHFAEATQAVARADIAETAPCGPDPEAHIEAIQAYVDAGFDMVAIHQVGSRQAEFLEFYEEAVLPSFD